ncbi:hypothetical protein [Luteimonas sp. MC1572]|uniref:hypothetical protein n=1 Tax=Luteimonas sp. MC1572 TaxID=2799325 RepID=UPI0018F0CB85|nr:hypothetical protein [Luteimonas sp. MC1572]MBJ6982169.1 hypothetical protein [Luteimonas sp. MC1572]QQO03453.1 hypothetical protein JGR64_01350 [Luteimonas sp. MC1572]
MKSLIARIVTISWIAMLLAGCAEDNAMRCSLSGHVDTGHCSTSILNIAVAPESYDHEQVLISGFVGDIINDPDATVFLLYPNLIARSNLEDTMAVKVETSGRKTQEFRSAAGTIRSVHVYGEFVANAGRGSLGTLTFDCEFHGAAACEP